MESDLGKSRVLQRFLPLWAGLRERAAGPAVRRYALAAATLVLLAGLYLSIRSLPPHLGLLRPELLVLSAVVGVPLAVIATVVETWLSARTTGVHFDWLQSFRVAIMASAANMLPLPGGTLVRISVLRRAGATLRASGAITALTAVAWIGIACMVGAVGASIESGTVAAILFVSGGAAAVIASLGIHALGRSWGLAAALLTTKVAVVAIDLWRMLLALGALGVAAGVREVSVFAVSGVAGAAVFVIPSGLGVSEAVAAILAPLTRLLPAAAFLATALNRATALVVLAPVAGLLALHDRRVR